jgi:hypothetical protein
VGVAVVASYGCALIVGDPDGHRLFTDSDAAEAATGEDATSAPDAAADGEPSEATVVTETSTPDGSRDAGPGDGAANSGGDAGLGVKCTKQYCAQGEVCCMSDPYNLPDGAACTSSSQCFATDVFYCASQQDCVNQGHPSYRCCGPEVYRTVGSMAYQLVHGSQCAPSCGGPSIAVLCDPGSPDPCPGMDAGCRTLPFLPGIYYSCQ